MCVYVHFFSLLGKTVSMALSNLVAPLKRSVKAAASRMPCTCASTAWCTWGTWPGIGTKLSRLRLIIGNVSWFSISCIPKKIEREKEEIGNAGLQRSYLLLRVCLKIHNFCCFWFCTLIIHQDKITILFLTQCKFHSTDMPLWLLPQAVTHIISWLY